MPRKLKVFRTPAGFHDAYVAAPSRKTALAAWGASADLFARGAAEEVTDPALMEAPLAAPGEVIKRSRGSAEEQLAAAPTPRRAGKPPVPKKKTAGKSAPRPSRAALDDAEAALDAAASTEEAERRELAKRRAALEREEKAAEQRWRTERRALEAARDTARERYDAALAKWRG